MIDRIEMKHTDLVVVALIDKINEMVGKLNNANTKEPEFLIQKKEPKWKAGDTAWFIYFGNPCWEVLDYRVGPGDIADGTITDPNYFKTKESAEKALEDVLEVMMKYE